MLCSIAIALANGVSAAESSSTRARAKSIAVTESLAVGESVAIAESWAKSNAFADRRPEPDACANGQPKPLAVSQSEHLAESVIAT